MSVTEPVRVTEPDQGQPRRGTLMMVLREAGIVIGMALLLSLIVKTWLMQAFYIPSESNGEHPAQG